MVEIFTVEEAADIANVKPALLKHWLATGQFKTSSRVKSEDTGEIRYYFTQEEIPSLIEFVATQDKREPQSDHFVDDGKQENFTVAQIASLWRLSRDTIQRIFQDEPGVVTLGNKNPRGKRRRVTLRIPRAVMDRVKKRRSNA